MMCSEERGREDENNPLIYNLGNYHFAITDRMELWERSDGGWWEGEGYEQVCKSLRYLNRAIIWKGSLRMDYFNFTILVYEFGFGEKPI